MSDALLEVQGLVKEFPAQRSLTDVVTRRPARPVRAVDGIDFELRAGEVLALACDPDVIVADEPTTALDVMIQAQILDLLGGIARDFGMGIILVTHDLGVVAQVCDRVVVMYGGVVAEENDATTLFGSPQHPYTQQLLLSFPDLAHPDRPLRGIPGAPPRLDAMPAGCRFAPRCPHAFDRCRVERPPDYPAAGGRASCFLLDPAERGR